MRKESREFVAKVALTQGGALERAYRDYVKMRIDDENLKKAKELGAFVAGGAHGDVFDWNGFNGLGEAAKSVKFVYKLSTEYPEPKTIDGFVDKLMKLYMSGVNICPIVDYRFVETVSMSNDSGYCESLVEMRSCGTLLETVMVKAEGVPITSNIPLKVNRIFDMPDKSIVKLFKDAKTLLDNGIIMDVYVFENIIIGDDGQFYIIDVAPCDSPDIQNNIKQGVFTDNFLALMQALLNRLVCSGGTDHLLYPSFIKNVGYGSSYSNTRGDENVFAFKRGVMKVSGALEGAYLNGELGDDFAQFIEYEKKLVKIIKNCDFSDGASLKKAIMKEEFLNIDFNQKHEK